MRLSEAARILGVEENADKQTIEKAARQQIRRWHPDRWRNASEAEQKTAAEEYSKVSKAQQIMQHPDMADPEPRDVPSPSYSTPQGFNFDTPTYDTPRRNATQPRRQNQDPQFNRYTTDPFDGIDDIFQEESARDDRRIKYNEARTFEDSFGAVPDTMEQTLNTMHNADIERQYKQFADIMKLSMSVWASVLLFIVSFILLLGTLNVINLLPLVGEGTIGGGIASILPSTTDRVPSVLMFGLLSIIALIKMVTHDAFIAPLISSKVRVMTPSTLCGIDIIIWGIVGYAISSLWTVPRIMYASMILIGAIVIMASVLVRMQREAA